MKLKLTLAAVICTLMASAQGVAVNPDGTHSHIINNGITSVIVNPNGTHSTVFNNGNTSVIINPNGTHSTGFRNGNTSVIINPDGTHSTAFHNGNTSVVLNSSGTTATVFNNYHVRRGEESEPSRNTSYAWSHVWRRGPVVPQGAFVDLTQWKSGPVYWVNVRKHKEKRRR